MSVFLTVLPDDTVNQAPSPPDQGVPPSGGLAGLPGRYTDLGPVARGAFGEVRRVRDTQLDRVLAVKVLHASLAARPSVRQRFFKEVQVTARLQHPGIVPVYDHGELSDGRLWYAMKEVRGRTLGAILAELFAAPGDASGNAAPGVLFRRAIDVFARTAQTVAYAHSRGVVHRDLKPDNVMVGEFGEVMVMDWGLARRMADPADEDPEGAGLADEDAALVALTRQGDVLGTPAYMPPEQAAGARDLHSPASDVYALGAILHHTLTGHPPPPALAGRDAPSREPPRAARSDLPVPSELARACQKALSPDITARCSAEELAADALVWLDGVRRREQALSVVARARALEPSIAALRSREAQASAEAQALLAQQEPFASAEQKRPAWTLQDESKRLGHEARLRETEWLQEMHSALRLDPELPEAHAALADHYRARVIEAEAQLRTDDAAGFEVMLRAHARGHHLAFLRGEGAVSIVTDPPGAEVRLERYEERDRRLQPVDLGVLGRTPLRGVPLARGSYRLRLRAPGRAEVLYPVHIERDTHWDGCAPGETEPQPIALPRENELGPDEIYVPAGFSRVGGDPNATEALPRRRLWVDGFVLGRFPVTCAQWVRYLNAQVDAGRPEEALAACPRKQLGATESGEVTLVLSRDRAGRFTLPPGWHPDMPIVLIDWHGAAAYARWLAQQTGAPWRLPNELEREKAARGADARLLPWGNHLDAAFACVVESHRAEPARVLIHEFPLDESPYGVRGLAGNVRDFCANLWRREGPRTAADRLLLDLAPPDSPESRTTRGGAWGSPLASAWSAGRFASRPGQCWQGVGVRVARSWPLIKRPSPSS